MKIFLLSTLLITKLFGGEGTNLTYTLPYDTRTETLRILNVANGSVSNDSILVKVDATDYTRRIAPMATHLAPYALNSSLAGYMSLSSSYSNPSNITSLAWGKITGAPTFLTTETDPTVPAYSKTLSGFSVIKTSTDALYKPIGYTPSWTDVTGKPTFTTVATSGSYLDLSNRPKIAVPYSGTTNASGVFTATFPVAYSVAPNIQANIINGADNQNIRITSVTTTGFTVLARTRVDVVGLLPTWNNASGLAVDVLITEK